MRRHPALRASSNRRCFFVWRALTTNSPLLTHGAKMSSDVPVPGPCTRPPEEYRPAEEPRKLLPATVYEVRMMFSVIFLKRQVVDRDRGRLFRSRWAAATL